MERLRFLTAGESHGPALVAILDGLPAGLTLTLEHFARDLQRRKLGYGRGGRMSIEPETPQILAGVRHGKTLGSPLAVLIENVDHLRAWSTRMAVGPVDDAEARGKEVSLPRPGHADLAGAIKFGHRDLRNSLERASARETAMRVALGAAARRLLDALDIRVGSFVRSIGDAHAQPLTTLSAELQALAEDDAQALAEVADASEIRALDAESSTKLCAVVDAARSKRDTVGGTFEVRVTGLPAGLGSYTQNDLKLDGKLARALACIHAIKAVELGDGWEATEKFGSEVHDSLLREGGRITRPTNRAGGLEGGVTNGETLIVRAAMKPIATVPAALPSVDLRTGETDKAHVERSDTCAVPAAAVIGEAMVALTVADALLTKLGGDSLEELQAALVLAWRRSRVLPSHLFLCGLSGAGKSTVGPLVAQALGLPFADVDAEIERESGKRVAEIFAGEGEAAFRAREAAAVRTLSRGPRQVIALGGGALGSRAVRLAVRRTGHLVWLAASVADCLTRLSDPGVPVRPLLTGDAQARLTALAEAREPLYASLADARVHAGFAPDQVKTLVLDAVQRLEDERAWA
ncbi:MAG: chorismate synthase [Deltaproteobacteria bacterium]|nr:chorismate synthase [Deltaproteobacteria bacterium]